MCQYNVRTFVRINNALQVTAESEERVLSVVSALTKIEDDLRAVLQQMQDNRSKGRQLYKRIQITYHSANNQLPEDRKIKSNAKMAQKATNSLGKTRKIRRHQAKKDKRIGETSTEEEVTINASDVKAQVVPTKTVDEILADTVEAERKLAEQVHRGMSIPKHVPGSGRRKSFTTLPHRNYPLPQLTIMRDFRHFYIHGLNSTLTVFVHL